MKNFIKVANQDLAKQLVDLGFQYIKEGLLFAFVQTDELMAVIQQRFNSNEDFICENKLRF